MSLRRAFKRAVFGVAWLVVLPAIVPVWLEKRLSRSEALFGLFSHLLALAPGPVGVSLRAAYYFATLDRCSWETHVGFGSLFTHRGATVGAQASMGCYCVLGHVDLGPAVVMASRVSVPSGKRQHLGDDGRFSAAPVFERVSIGAQTWVGEGAIILADVGPRCIISAGAVVTKEVGEGSLVGGNPAKLIKTLDSSIHEGKAG
jgi:acetyltransferase-like isoleucine patch superfamily enzyme